VVVWQHKPESQALAQAVWRLLGPRLRRSDPALDPLMTMAHGMERLAVDDAQQRLADLISQELQGRRARLTPAP
jgi:hypothetical protein